MPASLYGPGPGAVVVCLALVQGVLLIDPEGRCRQPERRHPRCIARRPRHLHRNLDRMTLPALPLHRHDRDPAVRPRCRLLQLWLRLSGHAGWGRRVLPLLGRCRGMPGMTYDPLRAEGASPRRRRWPPPRQRPPQQIDVARALSPSMPCESLRPGQCAAIDPIPPAPCRQVPWRHRDPPEMAGCGGDRPRTLAAVHTLLPTLAASKWIASSPATNPLTCATQATPPSDEFSPRAAPR